MLSRRRHKRFKLYSWVVVSGMACGLLIQLALLAASGPK
jgi:hypothetical protein